MNLTILYTQQKHFNLTMANETINDTGLNKTDIIDKKVVQASFCLLYTLIFILGIIGNVLVCYVVFRNKAMQTVTNLFITNLALSDILLCVFAVPLTPMYTFIGKWLFGPLLCHIMPYAQGCSVYISTLTLTSIAVDRFFVIIYPFHPRMKLRTCVCIIVFIWIFSLSVTFPYGLFMDLWTSKGVVFCEEFWPSEKFRKVFGTLTLIMQFLLPFIIIAFCYTCVSIRLNDRAKAKPGSKTSKREEADRDRKRRTNRMLISMVAIFGISWLPLNLINIVSDFHEKISDWKYYMLSFFFGHSMAMASTCYNPFLYAWLNENFRKEFKQVLPCFDTTKITVRGSFQSSRRPQHLTEKNCNGNNDTIQESLMDLKTSRNTSMKAKVHNADSVESDTKTVLPDSETVLIDGEMIEAQGAALVAYNTREESVKLQLICGASNNSLEASRKPLKNIL